jgi:3'(2'), 5'-bisphosphate nucleotidase
VADRDLTKLSDAGLALVVAERAGRLLLQLRHGRPAPTTPRERDALLVEADRSAHDLIVSALADARPNDLVLSEEGKDPADRLAADRLWIVDPVDGTREFGEGRPDFAVQIALWERGSDAPSQLTVAAVVLPAHGVSHVTDKPVVLAPVDPARPVRLVVSRTRPPANAEALLAALTAVTGRPAELLDAGSVGAKVEHIIAGRADAYVHDNGFATWDVAAPAAIASAAGLFVSAPDGSPLQLNEPSTHIDGVVVARPELAAALIEALNN